MAEILFMLGLYQGQTHQPMVYGSKGLYFLALSTFTVSRMQHRDKASGGLKTARGVQKLSMKEKVKGENTLTE